MLFSKADCLCASDTYSNDAVIGNSSALSTLDSSWLSDKCVLSPIPHFSPSPLPHPTFFYHCYSGSETVLRHGVAGARDASGSPLVADTGGLSHDKYLLHAAHGSATSMDGILIHGKRYLFMVVFHPSHGQISTNRMYLPMDIAYIHKISTKFMEKQPNMSALFSLYFHTNQII